MLLFVFKLHINRSMHFVKAQKKVEGNNNKRALAVKMTGVKSLWVCPFQIRNRVDC